MFLTTQVNSQVLDVCEDLCGVRTSALWRAREKTSDQCIHGLNVLSMRNYTPRPRHTPADTLSHARQDRRQEVLTIAWSAEVLTLASEVLTYVRGPHDEVHGGSAEACSPLPTPARVATPLPVGFLVFPFSPTRQRLLRSSS